MISGVSTTGEQILYSSRKLSDYYAVCITVGHPQIRGGITVPIDTFTTFETFYIPIIYAGAISEVDIKYVSDTKINITSNAKGLKVYMWGYVS